MNSSTIEAVGDVGPTGKNILVTGGAGFIGSHLVDILVKRNNVRVVDNFTSGFRSNINPDATLIQGDIQNRNVIQEAMTGVDIVFHEAAMVSVEQSIEQPRRSHKINVTATVNVLDIARKEDVSVVLASSAAIYGIPEKVPISEVDSKGPLSPYGLDKLTADRYARLYHNQYGLDTVSLRYFNAYGPRQVADDYSGVVSIFIEQAKNNEPITVEGEGKQTRDFVHVRDIVQANLRAATADVGGEAFNIGTGSSVTIRHLAETVKTVVDTESKIVHYDPRPNDIEQSQADISKVRSMLGYEPTVELDSGLKTLLRETSNIRSDTLKT